MVVCRCKMCGAAKPPASTFAFCKNKGKKHKMHQNILKGKVDVDDVKEIEAKGNKGLPSTV